MISSQQAMFGNQAAFAQQISGGYSGQFQQPYGNPGMLSLAAQAGQRPGNIGAEQMAMRGMQAGQSMMSGFTGAMSTVGQGAGMFGPPGMIVGGMMQGAAAGLNFGAGNLMTGAQQQMMLNQTLRSSFNFMGQGRQGFSRGDMTDIGGSLGRMSGQVGPGGEMAGFEELTRLTGKMGQSGMMTGVRDVQQFTSKFKEMIGALKTMARDLGTSLEGAMEFAAAQRSSGVFKSVDQTRFSGMARNMSLSGNVSMTEMTAMANIGSQISRSVGGLGRSGAFGGMKALGTVGTATQIGSISDEDIYNATGQTGAEGRQALATQMMQTEAKFLRSSIGRRSLASMAGADGKLDEAMVQRVMAGDMSVGATRGAGGSGIAKAGGRAGFIRNEGRLRGDAMEKFGGLLPAIQLRQWTQDRGMDLYDEDDDRGSIFAQRRLGVSRDEADILMKQARDLPNILKEQQRVARDDSRLRSDSERRGNVGLAGVQKKFQQVKHHVTESIQSAGRDLLNDGAELIDDMIQKLFGTYQAVMTKGTAKALDVLGGGSVRDRMKNFESVSTQFGTGTFGNTGQSSAIESFDKGRHFGEVSGGKAAAGIGRMLAGDVVGGAGMLFGSDRDRFTKAGFNMSGVKTDDDLRQKMEKIGLMQRVAGGSDVNKEALALGMSMKKDLQLAYAGEGLKGGISGEGEERLKNFAALLPPGPVKDAYEKALKEGKPEVATKIMRDVERGGGVSSKQGIGAHMEAPTLGSEFAHMTEMDKRSAMSKAFGASGSGIAGNIGKFSLLGSLGGASGLIAGAAFGAFKAATGGSDASKAVGRYLNKEDTIAKTRDLLGSDKGRREAAQEALLKEMSEQEDVEVKAAMMKMHAASELAGAGSESERQKILEKYKEKGLSETDINQAGSAMAGRANQQAKEQRDIAAKTMREESGKEIKALHSSGIVTTDEKGKMSVSKTTRAELEKTLGKGKAGGVEELILQAAELEKRMSTQGSSPEELKKSFDDQEKLLASMAGKTVEEQRAMAQGMAGTKWGQVAAAQAGQRERLEKAQKKGPGGKEAALLQEMGFSVSAKEMKGVNLTNEKEIRALLQRQGVKDVDDDLVNKIKGAATAQKSGNMGATQTALREIGDDKRVQAARQEKEKEGARQADPGAKLVEGAVKAAEAAIVGKLGAVVSAVEAIPGAGGGNGEDGPKKTLKAK